MEHAQKELIGVLLNYIRSLGLISNTTCAKAFDLVHTAPDFPSFFQYPVPPEEEVL